MSHSTRRSRPRHHQHAKPSKDFPLTAHPSGRWCKKVKGRIIYFGTIVPNDGGASAQAALDKWLNEKEDLKAGRVPRARAQKDGVILNELVGRFLDAKKALRDSGELSPHTWEDYHNVCLQLLAAFGKHRLITDLYPEDFAALRERWAKKWGPVRLGNTINKARVVFNFAYKTRLVTTPIFFGESFKRPSKKVMRLHRAEKALRMYEAEELRAMIDGATQPLHAMLLLAANAGLGNNDVATMRLKHVNLETAWLTLPRQKTGLVRRCPLWPETIQALKEWLTQRPTPKQEADADLVFVTVKGGSWAKLTSDNPISKETAKLLKRLKITGHRNFYAIRHGFQTIGDETRDFLAVRAIMGHATNDIADEYRERTSDERLTNVVNFVRDWLFADGGAGKDAPRLRLHVEDDAAESGAERKGGVA